MTIIFSLNSLHQDLSQTRLSKLTCEDFVTLLSSVGELKSTIDKLAPILRENAITGRVLLYCDLHELKSVLSLNFGNWEIFKLLIMSLREIENTAKTIPTVKTDSREVNDGASGSQQQAPPVIRMKQKSVIEKQVIFLITFKPNSQFFALTQTYWKRRREIIFTMIMSFFR